MPVISLPHVQDNFYTDPDGVRSMALNSNYGLTGKSKFNSQCAKPDPVFIQNGLDLLLNVVGQQWRPYFLESFFVSETEEDETKTRKNGAWVHYDRGSLIALIYLNIPEQCKGGTAFWRHKRTQISNRTDLVSYCDAHGQCIDRIMDDACDSTAWENMSTIEMKYNRLVVFNPQNFHAATGYFGDNRLNSRLFHQYVFDEQVVSKAAE